MDINEYTRAGIRPGCSNCTFTGYDVGLLLFNKVHHRTAHDTDESEVHNPDRYKYKINRSAEVNATRPKGIGNKYKNIGEFYN